ncbi:hypothetical protein RRG08_015582 [Elysia crispata]|uniref:Uncharacterized protein n=1 Tax=Elysia crispata TaxID=231223 RepID=A0AAE0YK07_9GAST|nr:hypothetical protein RRG08_015582 [Elysia crispata]
MIETDETDLSLPVTLIRDYCHYAAQCETLPKTGAVSRPSSSVAGAAEVWADMSVSISISTHYRYSTSLAASSSHYTHGGNAALNGSSRIDFHIRSCRFDSCSAKN